MPRNYQQKSGQAKMFKDDRFNSVIIPHPVIGIVKDNIDAARNGKIRVYLTDYGGQDPNDSNSWVTVSYMSPWFGATESSAPTDGTGKYLTNSHSYGFWATSPDIGTEVICVFVNGKPNQGYYIGCLPDSGAHFMVPAIGSSNRVVPNDTEATTYGGADRLPTVELNVDNPKYRDSPNQLNEPKPIHSYQAAILANQGLIRDNIRGVVGSTSMRESPSAVFGISTPGAPIWDGGYTRQNIKTVLSSNPDPAKLKIVGRQGGHSLVMDDGELLDGRNQMVRLRSAGGHQITMSDDGQVLFITHSNGQSWVELGPEGTVDVFSTNSFNVRTQGDINFHADRNINLNAAAALNINADSVSIESAKGMTAKVGADFLVDTAGKETHKTGGAYAVSAAGAASIASSGSVFVNGAKVNLNTGSGPAAAAVPAQNKTQHTETTFSKAKGWMYPAPAPTTSITSRLPTHQPFIGGSKGIDIKVSPTSSAGSASPSSTVSAATVATSKPPAVMTDSATVMTTPMVPAKATDIVNTSTAQALTSQNSVTVAMMTAAEKNAQGILPGAGGLTATQAEAAGYLKPGTAEAVMQNLAAGMPADMAAPPAMWTGKDGMKSASDFAASSVAQAGAVNMNIQQAAKGLVANNVITGNESQTQIGGVINAAFKNGVDTVTNLLKSSSTTSLLTGKIGAAMSAGTFASGLADKVTSGISGLGKSLTDLGSKASGLLTGLKDQATAALDSLKGTAKSAFETVESSFANLKGGLPNVLGGGDTPVAKQESPTDQAVNSYESAKLATAEYEDLVFSAKKEYRNDPSESNLAKLKDAEAKLAGSRQQQAKASLSILTTVGSSATSAISGTFASISSGLSNTLGSLTGGLSASSAANTLASQAKTTLNSGVNALPGGAGALQIDVASTVAGLGKGLINQAILSKTGLNVDIATVASKLTAGLSGVAPTTVATSTVDTAALTAKTGQLLGDARIPTPNFGPLPPPTTTTPTQIELNISAKAAALEEVKAANNELNAIARAWNADLTNKDLEKKFDIANARANAAIAAYEKLA